MKGMAEGQCREKLLTSRQPEQSNGQERAKDKIYPSKSRPTVIYFLQQAPPPIPTQLELINGVGNW
jgi:hypothetical protein